MSIVIELSYNARHWHKEFKHDLHLILIENI